MKSTPWLTMLFALLCISYGLFTLYIRVRRPKSLVKLTRMKEMHGAFLGNLIHLGFYSLFPLGIGLLLLLQIASGTAAF